jgi:hypothetical protein
MIVMSTTLHLLLARGQASARALWRIHHSASDCGPTLDPPGMVAYNGQPARPLVCWLHALRRELPTSDTHQALYPTQHYNNDPTPQRPGMAPNAPTT